MQPLRAASRQALRQGWLSCSGRPGGAADRHDPFLRALPARLEDPGLEVDVEPAKPKNGAAAQAVSDGRLLDAIKDVMIMLIPMFVVLALIIIFPQIPLFLPRLFPPGTL